jgi:two-component system, LuxR family, sensor kinase FixL
MDASTGIESVRGSASGARWPEAGAHARPWERLPRDWRPLGAAVLMGATYFAGAKIGMALTFAPLPLSVLWPPNALLFGALLLVPTRWWWCLLLGALPAHLLAELQAGVPLTMVLGWFASNATEALIGASIVRRFNSEQRGLGTARAVTVFFCAAICAPVLSSFLDAALVRLNGWGNADYWTLWLARVPSNLLSVLTFVPVMITCAALDSAQLNAFTPRRRLEATGLIVGLLLVGIVAFDAGLFEHETMLLYLPVPFLVWAAMRFGPALTSLSFTIVVFLVIWGATHGQGPFQGAARHDNALPLQMFLITIAVPLLWLAAVIHERRHAESRLQASEQLFSTAFMSSPDAIAISLRGSGHIIEANQRWLDLLGYRRDHLGRGEVAPLLNHVAEDASAKAIAMMRTDESLRDAEVPLRDRDGRPRQALVSMTPVTVQGQACTLCVVRDITQQRQAEHSAREQQRQLAHVTRLASMSDFSNSLAHELSQPLTAILSNAQAGLRFLAREPLEVDELRTILSEIAEADKRAGLLIQHMRQMMRRGDLELADLDVNDVATQVLNLAHGEFVTRDVEVTTSLSSGLPAVRGDRVQLQQLLLNLVANACEAMRAGAAPKVLTLTTLHASDNSVQIVVSDNGPGVPSAQVDSIFDAFFTTKAQGLGMGLPICRQIAQMHGGALNLDAGSGGASFRLSLPARRTEGDPA